MQIATSFLAEHGLIRDGFFFFEIAINYHFISMTFQVKFLVG